MKKKKKDNIIIDQMDNLSQGTFQFSKIVGFLQTAVFTVDVIHFKPELLYHLKIVVNDNRFGELGVQAVHDCLRPAYLKRYGFQSHVPFCKIVFDFTAVGDAILIVCSTCFHDDCGTSEFDTNLEDIQSACTSAAKAP